MMKITRTLLYEFQLDHNSSFIASMPTLQEGGAVTIKTNNKLISCPKCHLRLQEPITLSCGFTLCYSCYYRSNQVPTVTIKQQCLSFTCLRYHDCETQPFKRNILLTQILALSNGHDDHGDIGRKILESMWNMLDCPICLSKLSQPVTLSSCGHTFCKCCLTACRPTNCPLCRQETIYNYNNYKIDQSLSFWISHITTHVTSSHSSVSPMATASMNSNQATTTTNALPFFQITTDTSHSIPPPRLQTRCMLHIQTGRHNSNNQTRILTNMLDQPFRKHYALCAFTAPSTRIGAKYNINHFEEALLLEVEHMEYSPDLQHAVIQAKVLYYVSIDSVTSVIRTDIVTGEIQIQDGKSRNKRKTRRMTKDLMDAKPSLNSKSAHNKHALFYRKNIQFTLSTPKPSIRHIAYI